jgi:hypothetical protein
MAYCNGSLATALRPVAPATRPRRRQPDREFVLTIGSCVAAVRTAMSVAAKTCLALRLWRQAAGAEGSIAFVARGGLFDVTAPSLTGLQAAHQSTLELVSARIELVSDRGWEIPSMPNQRRGGLLRPLLKGTKWAAKQLLANATQDFDFRHQSAEGVLDMTARRYMLDYGNFARLYADGQEWHGRSGRAIATLPPDAGALPTPLWLLDLLSGLTDAIDVDTEHVRGVRCRHLAAKADLSLAAQATSGAVAVPACPRFDDLLALPVDVWVDESHIRRIRFSPHQRIDQRTETLDLWDLGILLDDLDWTRLPTFRSADAVSATAPIAP